MNLRIDSHYEYMIISDHSWKKVSLNNSRFVNYMIQAANRANIHNHVTISFLIDDEDEVLEVYSHTSIPYYPNEGYLQKFLQSKLDNMLKAHSHFDYFIQEMEDEITINNTFPTGNKSIN